MQSDSPIRIMIVDDQATMRTLVRSSLRQLGYNDVVECCDGDEALKELKLQPPQLIIADINMPKLDGMTLLRAVRSDPVCKKTPFIMLTSRGEANTVMKSIELGVNNYIVKPFNLASLKKKIEAVIGPLA
jgi:two-component system, chemotaxis family, chemotaxis protein CheY